jgi:16S rRNA (uracil1498-N3)-methyltransferase
MSVRVTLATADLRVGSAWPLDDRATHYLLRVHRLRAGDLVTVFSREGVEIDARLERGEPWRLVAESPLREGLTASPVTVYYALPKGDKVDRVVRQLSELGVERLVLFSGVRSVVKLTAARAQKKLERWRRIAEEAARQCGRSDSLMISGPVTLSEILESLGETTALVFEPAANNTLDQVEWTCPVALFIGPEGGISPDELLQMKNAGVLEVRLGPLVLRTETAAPVAAALVLDRIGALS